mmetsp:Transcript_925/g.2348  ORF Transcript_925/g.2348 Transcript_925/m.2348 type:complete len:240 (+) Transcript_925:1731-2450(+)
MDPGQPVVAGESLPVDEALVADATLVALQPLLQAGVDCLAPPSRGLPLGGVGLPDNEDLHPEPGRLAHLPLRDGQLDRATRRHPLPLRLVGEGLQLFVARAALVAEEVLPPLPLAVHGAGHLHAAPPVEEAAMQQAVLAALAELHDCHAHSLALAPQLADGPRVVVPRLEHDEQRAQALSTLPAAQHHDDVLARTRPHFAAGLQRAVELRAVLLALLVQEGLPVRLRLVVVMQLGLYLL